MNFNVELTKSKNQFDSYSQTKLKKSLAIALTKTASDAVFKQVRPNLSSKFKLKNHWTRSGIRYESASTSTLTAVVKSVDSYMKKQETGGYLQPENKNNWAIPSKSLRRKYRVIPFNKRPTQIRKEKDVIFMPNFKQLVRVKRVGGKAKFETLYTFKKRASFKERFGFYDDVRVFFKQNIAKNYTVARSKT